MVFILKYFISSFVVSIISLLFLLISGNSNDVILVLISYCISLLPFLVDFVLFMNNSKDYQGDIVFRRLRKTTIIAIVLIAPLFIVWALVGLQWLKTPNANNLTYLCFNNKSDFIRSFNSKGLEKALSHFLSISAFRIYFIFVFIISTFFKFLNAKFYGEKIEKTKNEIAKIKKDLENKGKQ